MNVRDNLILSVTHESSQSPTCLTVVLRKNYPASARSATQKRLTFWLSTTPTTSLIGSDVVRLIYDRITLNLMAYLCWSLLEETLSSINIAVLQVRWAGYMQGWAWVASLRVCGPDSRIKEGLCASKRLETAQAVVPRISSPAFTWSVSTHLQRRWYHTLTWMEETFRDVRGTHWTNLIIEIRCPRIHHVMTAHELISSRWVWRKYRIPDQLPAEKWDRWLYESLISIVRMRVEVLSKF